MNSDPISKTDDQLKTSSPDPSWVEVMWAVVKGLTCLILVSVIAYKIGSSDWNQITIVGFDFSQLLSLLLAFFSIGLSAMFYFKATDTSNAFYDRTHHFMKDVAEVLARIEERFGERLQSIHDDTVGLRRDFMQSGNDRVAKSVATTDAIGTPDATSTKEES